MGIGVWQFFQFHDGKLHLVFCDVGQGDAIYLKTPSGQEVLIDGGPDEKVLDCLSSHRPFYDRKIEMVILTHPQADHLTGLLAVFQRYKVDYFVVENIFNPSAIFAQFRQAPVQEKVRLYNPKAGDKIRLGETEINFYWPKEVIGDKRLWLEESKTEELQSEEDGAGDDPNFYSLVFDIRYKDFTAFQTGDAESQILGEAISWPQKTIVLKVPHHGSKNSLSSEILNLLRPQLAVISVGKENHFGHPAANVLKLLKDGGTEILRTDQDGEIEVISSGEGLIIKNRRKISG